VQLAVKCLGQFHSSVSGLETSESLNKFSVQASNICALPLKGKYLKIMVVGEMLDTWTISRFFLALNIVLPNNVIHIKLFTYFQIILLP
jgi:hypothetical protein